MGLSLVPPGIQRVDAVVTFVGQYVCSERVFAKAFSRATCAACRFAFPNRWFREVQTHGRASRVFVGGPFPCFEGDFQAVLRFCSLGQFRGVKRECFASDFVSTAGVRDVR